MDVLMCFLTAGVSQLFRSLMLQPLISETLPSLDASASQLPGGGGVCEVKVT